LTALFLQKVGIYGPRLMHDVGMSDLDAAATFGNVGHECAGFTAYHEGGQPSRYGGVSWCQWTGARRRLFEAWCRQHGLALTSDAAGYGFLVHELTGAEAGAVAAMKHRGTLEAKVAAFEAEFERARVKAISRRVSWARLALSALHPGHPATVAQPARSGRRRPVADKHKVHH
jgi:hypothetical protein